MHRNYKEKVLINNPNYFLMSHVSLLEIAQLLKPYHQSGHDPCPSLPPSLASFCSAVIFNGSFITQTLKTQLFKDTMLSCSISFTQNEINIKYF